MSEVTEQEQNIPTNIMSQPIIEEDSKKEMHLFGRRKISVPLEKENITGEIIKELLPQIMRIHNFNANEIEYLYNYYKGNQPILQKSKKVRKNINNKVVENHAFEVVEFKKGYVFGDPVQYVQKGEKRTDRVNPALSQLNKYMESEDKASKDKELAEWWYICGTAYRWADADIKEDNDEAPFEISIPDPRRTFVVYNSGIKGEPLFSGHITTHSRYTQVQEGTMTINNLEQYKIITIYTDSYKYQFEESFDGETNEYKPIKPDILVNNEKLKIDAVPLIIKGQRIIEYPLNSSRIGLIELIITPLNAINQIKSADVDDVEQFVQSLLVFINQEVDKDKFQELVEMGAVEVMSQKGIPADVKLLSQQILHSETKIVTDDLYNNILTICGIPRLNHKASGGDTGQARLLGEGWTMADERAKQDELSFIKSERQFLKLILNICKDKKVKAIENLKVSEVDIKFQRNKSDNLLVKAESLTMLIQAGIHPEIAIAVCGAFSDSHDVYARSCEYYGKDYWKKDSNKDNDTQVDLISV